ASAGRSNGRTPFASSSRIALAMIQRNAATCTAGWRTVAATKRDPRESVVLIRYRSVAGMTHLYHSLTHFAARPWEGIYRYKPPGQLPPLGHTCPRNHECLMICA